MDTNRHCAPYDSCVGAIFGRLNERVERLEDRFGSHNLFRTIAALDLDHVNGHVDRYRGIIRAGGWANEHHPSGFEDFVADFEASCAVYADVAFIALDHLARGYFDSDMVLRLAVGSEALRGQYGKQSPTGLDARLAEIEEFLTEKLTPAAAADTDELLIRLCTPTAGPSSAELAMLEDFQLLRKSTSVPCCIDDIDGDSPSTRPLRSFLRHHCRWSQARLQQIFEQLDDDLLENRVEQAREHRRVRAREQQEAIDKVNVLFSEATANRILEAAAQARVLNGLNLAVEPVFSFKGCLGLIHGEIFERCDGNPQNAVAADYIQKMKWGLLTNARNQMEEPN